MTTISNDSAIASARRALKVDDSVPARAWFVQRLDNPEKSYYLVVFGREKASSGLAVVDSNTGEVSNSARLPGTTAHLTVTAEQALSFVREKNEAMIDLVWKPCAVTRSPFYPLWRIRTASETIYVDQQGNPRTDLNHTEIPK